ncbi:MAG: sugar phosphate isomerase/epimerase [Lentisphaeria bacterium]|nr:sugar phosphate isomerase/epimerase [Lentisphaeria bacterium]
MQLGIVTYNIAAKWDLPTMVEVCSELGFSGVELRTTHAHGVETTLSAAERAEVKARFADSAVTLVGLGSAFEYHSADSAELRSNIDGTKEYVKLAADVGATGVKVRPNGLPEGVPVEKTLEQIGLSLREVGAFAADYGVEIRCEVHGSKTCHVPYMASIFDTANHPNVKACWNSNPGEVDEDGALKPNFDLLADRIGLVHINRFHSGYPYAELFSLLKATGYEGFCLAEIAGGPDLDSAKELLRYYKLCFQLLGGE